MHFYEYRIRLAQKSSKTGLLKAGKKLTTPLITDISFSKTNETTSVWYRLLLFYLLFQMVQCKQLKLKINYIEIKLKQLKQKNQTIKKYAGRKRSINGFTIHRDILFSWTCLFSTIHHLYRNSKQRGRTRCVTKQQFTKIDRHTTLNRQESA